MRKNRIIWCILWILSLVGISFFGGVLSYGFFWTMTFLPVCSLLYLLYVYICFHIYQRVDAKVLVVNQRIPFFFTLVNEYPISFVGVRVRFFTTFSTINGLSDETEYEFLPQTQVTKETGLICKYRGEYEVGMKTVEIQDYFRLFRISYHNRETLRVIVKPELIQLDALQLVDINNITSDSQRNANTPDVLTRSYLPGDDVRQIHWALTAKSGELMVRQMIGEEQEGVSILLDTVRCSKDNRIYLPIENKLLEITLALSFLFLNKGIPVKEYHLDTQVKCHRMQQINQFDEFYENISAISFSEDKTQDRFMKQMETCYDVFQSHTVFLILQTWAEETAQLLRELRKHRITVVIYWIGNEIPDTLTLEFEAGVKLQKVGPDDHLREVL